MDVKGSIFMIKLKEIPKFIYKLLHRHKWKIEVSAIYEGTIPISEQSPQGITVFKRDAIWTCTRCGKTLEEHKWAFTERAGSLHGIGGSFIMTSKAITLPPYPNIFNDQR